MSKLLYVRKEDRLSQGLNELVELLLDSNNVEYDIRNTAIGAEESIASGKYKQMLITSLRINGNEHPIEMGICSDDCNNGIKLSKLAREKGLAVVAYSGTVQDNVIDQLEELGVRIFGKSTDSLAALGEYISSQVA